MTQPGRTLLKAGLCVLAALAVSACSLGRSNDRPSRASAEAAMGVNTYLWRASLDTLNFMPLASADPHTGLIITDWHSTAGNPTERFRAQVYILDSQLRADALNVSIFRQTLVNGVWTDAAVDAETEVQIENAILTRARQLRLGAGGRR